MPGEQDRIFCEPSEQMVVIPHGNTPYSVGIAVFEDSVDALRRFVLDSLARAEEFIEVRDKDDDVEIRVPVVVSLVPRPDNTYNPKAISVAAPPSHGGSVVDRHMGFMYDSTLHWVGEALYRLADAALPHPIGCRGWIKLRLIEGHEAEYDDDEWEVDRHTPYSRAEMLEVGYWIDGVRLNLPDKNQLRELVDVFVASARQTGMSVSVEDSVRSGLIKKFGGLLSSALANRVATGSWGVATERSRDQDRRDAVASADLAGWVQFRSVPHCYEGIRAITRSVWGFDRVLITDRTGLEIGQFHLPDGPLTLIDERTRPDAIAALRDHGVDVSVPESFDNLAEFPDATIRTDRFRDSPVDREKIWSIRLVKDGVGLDELPEAGMYDPVSGALTVYARPHIGPMTTLLRRHGVDPAEVHWAAQSNTIARHNLRAAMYMAADLGPFRLVEQNTTVNDLRGLPRSGGLSVIPASSRLTSRAIDLVPEVHQPWLNARVVQEPTRPAQAYTLDIQRNLLAGLFGTDDIDKKYRPCRLCGTTVHSTRSGFAYCLDCCILARDGILRDNGTDGPWTDATIWALRRLAQIEFSGPPSSAQLARISVTDPDLADMAMLCRFLIPRKHSEIARPGRKKRNWADWLNAAGLLTDASRSSRGVVTTATDGHLCRSMFERHIDDFLHHHGIEHEVEPHYPRHHLLNTAGMRADWLLADGTYVEALGMMAQEDYAIKVRRKIELANLVGIRLITVLPKDLDRLPEIFADWANPTRTLS